MKGKNLAEGSIIKNMTVLIIPMFFSNLLNQLYNITDGIWIGQLTGDTGMSAITNVYPIIIIISCISIGFGLATSVLISRFYGAKDESKIKRIMGASYAFGCITAVLTTLIGIIFVRSILKVLNTPQEVFEATRAYIVIYLLTFVFSHILQIITEALRSIGDSKSPLIFVALGTVLNIILDPILIQGFWIIPGMGVIGASIATSISIFVSFIVAVLYINKKNKLLMIDLKELNLELVYVKYIFKIGMPALLQSVTISILILFEVYISNLSGVIGSSAYGAVSKLEQVMVVLSASFRTALAVMVSQFIGAGKKDECKLIMKEFLKLASIPSLIIALIVTVFAKPFIMIFINDPLSIAEAIKYLAIVGFSYITFPLKSGIKGFIAGTGHTKVVFVTALLGGLLAELPVILILINMGFDSLVCLGWGITAYVAFEIAATAAYYFTDRWKIEVLRKDLLESI